MAASGFFDKVNQGVLEGWASTENALNRIEIAIGDDYKVVIPANRFRQDLAEAGIRKGYAFFRTPIPVYLLDSQPRQISMFDAESHELITRGNLRLEALPHVDRLEQSLIDVRGSLALEDGMRLAVFVGYERQPFVSQNSRMILRALKEAGFRTVFVLAVDRLEADDWSLDGEADLVILRKNWGYDFGSWAHGVHYLRKLGLKTCSQLLLVNDSILWTGQEIGARFLPPPETPGLPDILGAVESFERTRHLQSYFLLIAGKVVEAAHLDEFLFYQAALSDRKDDTIQNFELKTSKFFEQRGYRVAAVLGYNELASAAQVEFERHVKRIESKALHAGHRWDNSARRLMFWHERIAEGMTCNPSHVAWFALIDNQFPFVKKELLSKNPAEVPLYAFIRERFSEAADAVLREYLDRADGFLFPLRRAAQTS